MRIRKHSFGVYMLGMMFITQSFTACSLLPKEETKKNVLMVETQERQEYQLALVQKDEIKNSTTLYCTYTQRIGEELSFGQDGLEVEAIYVKVGDEVKKGDLLAETKLGDIDDKICELETSIGMLEMELDFIKKQHKLNLELQQIYLDHNKLSSKEYANKKEQLEKEHELLLSTYEDERYLSNLRLNEYKKIRDAGRIYAGMDGVVTYVFTDLIHRESSVDQIAITIMNPAECAFRASSEYVSHYEEGELVNLLLSDGSTIETLVLLPEEESNVIYFQLLYPDFQLPVGSRATTELVLEHKEDVLVIPNRALRKTTDYYYVYMQNEDGMKVMQPITIGISGNGKTEVTGGLKDQDIIIIK